MRCTKCGHDNSSSSQFCANCGAELAPAESLHPGQTMNAGQYRVVRQLGKGGMGAIYLAENTQAFRRLCVIKEMLAYYEPGDEQKAAERFEVEARTLAALKHPGIPDMYGYFREHGHNFIVMEYIEGKNLEQLMCQNVGAGHPVGAPLAVSDVVRFGVEVCRVLEYLAAVKPEPVVHCDIKPANIIIDRNSHQAVLVDFGTAKARYTRAQSQGAVADSPAGEQPSVYGTVGYAAPELYRGQAVPESDVFSLAATMYHLLTVDDPRDHPFKWPKMDEIPPVLSPILGLALAASVDERLDAEGFRRQMEAYRASQAGTVQPLTFPESNQATTLTGLLDLSLRHWDYARQILYDGSLDAWLRHTLHDPVAANHVREATNEFPDLPDAGLDTFVRGLNARIPEPTLTLSPSTVDLGTISPGESKIVRLTLHNVGPNGSHGSVVCAVPWLSVSPRQYGLGPGMQRDIVARLVDTDRLPANKPQMASIVVSTSSGQRHEAELRFRVSRRSARRPAAPPQQPGAPAQPAPSSGAGKGRRTGLILAGLVVVIAVLLGLTYVYQWIRLPSGPAIDRGIAALERGDWVAATKSLAELDSADRDTVRRVAALLEAEMVSVPGGTLQMGFEAGSLDQRPVHPVAVPAFEMGRFPVSNVQFQDFVEQSGHPAPLVWKGRAYPAGTALRPVVGVTWEDALAYAEWAGKRLPTEAEWEWAARGDESRPYPWGNDEDSSRLNSQEGGLGRTSEIGAYPQGATPQGTMDLAGNVREWTADRYGPYLAAEEGLHAPPSEGDGIAVRGSSWRTYNDLSSARGKVYMSTAEDDLGFRCVQ